LLNLPEDVMTELREDRNEQSDHLY